MIGRVRGTLIARHATEIVVDVVGIGYRVTVPPNLRLPAIGSEVTLDTHLHVREDSLMLYGFTNTDGRELFELLLSCPGIGPKVALACLSVLAPDALRAAVSNNDIATLTLVPGIGKRSAEKLVFELGPKIGMTASVADVGSHDEVRDALANLGYGDREISKAVAGLPSSGDLGESIRSALRALGGSQ